MKAVVLAAGEGKRLHPLTYTRPKVMVPLAGKPILEHVILELKRAGIDDIVLIVGYFDQAIRNYFGKGEGLGARLEYVTQRKQLGTGDAIGTINGLVNDNFLVVSGDAIVRGEDLRRIMAGQGNVMGLVELEDTSDLGVVEVDGSTVRRIHEKVANPPTKLVNAGVYRFTPSIFPAISQTPKSPRGEYELTDSLQLLIDGGARLSYEMLGRWINVSYPWDMLAANEQLLAEMSATSDGEVEGNVVLKGHVFIGKGTVVRSGAYIIGPVVIGQGCEIGPNCYIRPSTAIGDRCHIGAGVEVKNSIIMNDTKIPHLNYVGDSIIGENCNLGAGTKVANLRLDRKNIEIGRVDTGRRKLGAILGDGVQTGINASLNVGCSIGNNTVIGPGVVASGVIRPRARVF